MNDQNLEELEAAKLAEIQRLSQFGSYFASAFLDDKKHAQDDWEATYQKYVDIKTKVLDLASDISDEFFFSAACHMIIGMLMKAEEFDEAKKLFEKVSVDMIKEKIIEEHPSLKKRWFRW